MTDHPDDELVLRARRGDRAAFAELVGRWQHRIFGLCLRWIGDAVQAEEVAQDVFLAAWRGLPSFRGEARFDTWLRHIAVNKCRNRRQSQRRRAHDRHDPLEEAAPLALVQGGPATDARVHQGQAEALLRAALDALPEEHRAVLVLRDLEDLTYDEIGDLLELPAGTVRSRLHRARAALAEVLTRQVRREDVIG